MTCYPNYFVTIARSNSRTCSSTATILASRGSGIFGALGHDGQLLDSEGFKNVDLSKCVPPINSVKQVSSGWGHSSIGIPYMLN